MNDPDLMELAENDDEIIIPKTYRDLKRVIDHMTDKSLDRKIVVKANGQLFAADLKMAIDLPPLEMGQFFFETTPLTS